jgi:methylglyoxal synthase
MTARRKRIALIAHDNMKPDILEWATYNRGTLERHELFATGTTGAMIASALGLTVHRFRSGPLGGDQQVGDVDVKALLRVAVVYNVPIACNRATADFLLSSPLMEEEYERRLPDLDGLM